MEKFFKVIKTEYVERIEVEGSMNDRSKILSWLFENNYTLKIHGPKFISEGRCDMEIFEAVAERIVENGTIQ